MIGVTGGSCRVPPPFLLSGGDPDARQAQALVEAVRPRVVVPMHYRGDGFGLEVLSPVDEFLSLRSDVMRYPDSVLELTADTPAQTAVLACPRG